MLICRPDDYQKANDQKCYSHIYLINTLKLFKLIYLELSIKQHEYKMHYFNEFKDYFLLIPD